jgi:hypothetical protein
MSEPETAAVNDSEADAMGKAGKPRSSGEDDLDAHLAGQAAERRKARIEAARRWLASDLDSEPLAVQAGEGRAIVRSLLDELKAGQ